MDKEARFTAVTMIVICTLAFLSGSLATFSIAFLLHLHRGGSFGTGKPFVFSSFSQPKVLSRDEQSRRQIGFGNRGPQDVGGASEWNGMRITKVAENPRILWIENFLSSDECDALARAAGPYFSRSTVANGSVSRIRTSSTAYLGIQRSMPADDKELVDRIVCRASVLSEVPKENFEPPQVVKYEKGQKYDPHFDFFSPGCSELERGGNRRETFFVYLTDVPEEEGGQTEFPRIQLQFQPRKGCAIYWSNINLDGSPNFLTWHGGKPPTGDTVKIACNIWTRHGPCPWSNYMH